MRVYTNTFISTRNTFYITLVSKMSVHICGRFVFPPYAPINVMPAGGGGGAAGHGVGI